MVEQILAWSFDNILPIASEFLETEGHSKIFGIKAPSVQMCSVKFPFVQLIVIFSSLLKSTLIGLIVDPAPASSL